MGKNGNGNGNANANAPAVELNMTNVDLNPNASANNSNDRDRPLDKFTRRISNVSTAIQLKFRTTREEGDFTLGCLKLFHTRTRFLIMVLVLLCLASVWSNILTFNFAVICMNPHSSSNMTSLSLNGTEERPPIEFTPRQKSLLTAAVAASALAANFPVVTLVNQFGIRTVFTILGLLSAVATCLIPTATYYGYYYVLGARVLQGIAFAANFPVIGAFTSKWTYYKQNGLFVSVLVAYVQLSPALTMPVSGTLCTSPWGWPSVYYAHGIFSMILFVLFGTFYRNSPGKHPFVGDVEIKKIAVGKSECSKEELKRIPYGPILKTASVWAVWIAAIGNFTCVNMMFLYSPSYLHHVLKFQVHSTGLSAAIPPLLQFSIKLLAGFTSDKVRCISETSKLKVYNSIAFFGSAVFLALLAFGPTDQQLVCLALLGIAAGILGFTTGGFFKAGPLVSKHYSHFVTGNVSLGITITMLVVPFMVSGLAPNNTAVEWRYVFLLTGAVLLFTNFVFLISASAEPASWTTDEFSRNASRNRIHSTNQASMTTIREFAPEVKMG